MSPNNEPETNNPSFDTEFSEEQQNFDQDPAVIAATTATTTSSKRGWWILILGILGTGAYLGYRYYVNPANTGVKSLENTASIAPIPAQTEADKGARQAQKNAQFELLKSHLFDHKASSKAPANPPPPVANAAAAPPPAQASAAPKPVTPTTAAAAPSAASTIAPKDADSMHTAIAQVTQLNEGLALNIHQIQALEQALQGITQSIAKLNADISAMDSRLLALSNSTGHLSLDMNSMKQEMSSVKRVLGEEGALDMPVPPPPSHQYLKTSQMARPKSSIPAYLVHAIIPGRAWLKNNNGQIMTVTEGDTLGDYGKVLVIDAASGVVLTSSGSTFQ